MKDRRKLERFIEVRGAVKQARQGELAEVRTRLAAAERDAREAEDAREHVVRALVEAGELRGDELIHRATLVDTHQRILAKATGELGERSSEERISVEALVVANREVRVLELLEKDIEAQRRLTERRLEQRDIDEAVSRRGGSR